MSDHDTDPMDQAYAQAETLLDDADARAARRARVLAAVAAELAAEPQAPPAPRRSGWGPGGWLVAASVAGVSVLIATQINQRPSFERPTGPPAEAAPTTAASAEAQPATARPGAPPAIRPPQPAPEPPARARAQPPLDEARPSSSVAAIPPLALPPVAAPAPPPPPPAPPPAAATESRIGALTAPRAQRPAAPGGVVVSTGRRAEASSEEVSELVVTGQKIERAPPQDVPLADVSKRSLDALSDRLRRAAAGGRTREISALLSRGVPIDAADDDGETALMKAIQARQVDATALLRRRGASLDLRNHEGRSARDLAADLADPALNKALGLDR